MTEAELREQVLNALASAVPGMDKASLAPGKNIRDQLDMDSMDFLNYVLALHEALKVDIPERDYNHLSSIDDAVNYLAAKLKESGSA